MQLDPASYVPLILTVCFFITFGVVGTVFFFASRARPQRSGVQRAAGVGEWNGRASGGPGLIGASALGSTYGVFRLEQGALTFWPDGASAPAWTIPCTSMIVRRNPMFSLSMVSLFGPYGELRCDVSREHINRLSTNDFKWFRERRYADEFIGALCAWGAQPG